MTTQTTELPVLFVITTKELTHSVGSSNSMLIPRSFICLSVRSIPEIKEKDVKLMATFHPFMQKL